MRRVEHERLLGAERQGERAVRADLQVGDAQAEFDRDIVRSGGEVMRKDEGDPILLEPPAVVLGQFGRRHPPIAERHRDAVGTDSIDRHDRLLKRGHRQ